MKIEMYNEDLQYYTTLVHEALEGRYDLTGYDLHVIEAALHQYLDTEVKVDNNMKKINGGLAAVFSLLAPLLPIQTALSLDDTRDKIISDIRNMFLGVDVSKKDKAVKPKPQSKPMRLKRSRKGGFKMSKCSFDANGLDYVYVGRGTRWGNPFAIGKSYSIVRLEQGMIIISDLGDSICVKDANTAVELYEKYIALKIKNHPHIYDLSELRGKNLFCWCDLNSPCHADSLLMLANA